MRIGVFDIETTDIPDLVSNIQKIYCIAIKINDEDTKCYTYLYTPYSDGNLKQALNILNSCDLIVGHNICKFDIPVIEKLLGKIEVPICDTLIDAKLMFSKDELINIDYSIPQVPVKLKGSYSLKAFGYRFNLNKIEYDDFSGLNERMVEYCKRDVDLTYKLYHILKNHHNYPTKEVRECEYKVASIIFKQQEFGCYFDINLAMDIATKLKFKQLNIENKLKKEFPPIFEPDGDVVTPTKDRNKKLLINTPVDRFINIRPFRIPLRIQKNGTYKFPPKSTKWKVSPYKVVNQLVSGEYQKIKLVKFNPGSRQQILKRLEKKFGYQTKLYTAKGNPKLDLDDIEENE